MRLFRHTDSIQVLWPSRGADSMVFILDSWFLWMRTKLNVICLRLFRGVQHHGRLSISILYLTIGRRPHNEPGFNIRTTLRIQSQWCLSSPIFYSWTSQWPQATRWAKLEYRSRPSDITAVMFIFSDLLVSWMITGQECPYRTFGSAPARRIAYACNWTVKTLPRPKGRYLDVYFWICPISYFQFPISYF